MGSGKIGVAIGPQIIGAAIPFCLLEPKNGADSILVAGVSFPLASAQLAPSEIAEPSSSPKLRNNECRRPNWRRVEKVENYYGPFT